MLYQGSAAIARKPRRGGGGNGGGGGSYTTDATSGWAFPQNVTEWNELIVAAGVSLSAPGNLHLCQDPSGDLADSIGVTPLAAGGATRAYQQAVSGFSTKAAQLTDGTTGFWSSATPSPYVASVAQLAWVSFPVHPAANRVVFGPNANPSTVGGLYVGHTTTGTILGRCDANSATGTGAYSSSVHLVMIKYDRTNSVCAVYTDLEKLVVPFKLLTGSEVGVGLGLATGGASTPGAGFLCEAEWSGAAAEALTDAVVRAIFGKIVGTAMTW